MAANIDTFASVRIPAWHGLGVVTDGYVGINEFQKLAGLEWEVQESSVYTDGMIQVPGVKAIVRTDNNYPLGIVGKDYHPFQNDEMFAFIRALGEFDLDLKIETAGALGKGETVWAMVRMESMKLALGNDVVDPFLTICNGHIGNLATTIFPTTVRVVCQNTLRMAMKGRAGKVGLSKGWAIRHTLNHVERLEMAKTSILEALAEWNTSKEVFSRMADIKASDDFILDLIAETFGEKKGTSKRGDTLTENRNKAIFANLESGTSKGLDTEGSIWSALNALTEFLDHGSIIRSGNKEEARFQNNLIDGPSVKYKEKAFDYAYSVAMA
jgi:phage/plasmid-like protein (TIGR03299 family)